MTWLETEPPKDGTPFIADVGYPWAVVAMWNGANEKFVHADPHVNMYHGLYNDWYFENEFYSDVKRWQPLPAI